MANHTPIVLIIEDDPLVSMLYEDIVIDTGLSVGGCFDSCKSAEEWLSVNDADAAIIDIKLRDGYSAKIAKKLCGRKIPFLVVSGYSANNGTDEVFQSAPSVAKPLTPDTLQLALRSVLAASALNN